MKIAIGLHSRGRQRRGREGTKGDCEIGVRPKRGVGGTITHYAEIGVAPAQFLQQPALRRRIAVDKNRVQADGVGFVLR